MHIKKALGIHQHSSESSQLDHEDHHYKNKLNESPTSESNSVDPIWKMCVAVGGKVLILICFACKY